jgi:hypothetical protein
MSRLAAEHRHDDAGGMSPRHRPCVRAMSVARRMYGMSQGREYVVPTCERPNAVRNTRRHTLFHDRSE